MKSSKWTVLLLVVASDTLTFFPILYVYEDAKKLTFTPLPFDQLEDEAQYDCHGCEEKNDEKASKYQKVHQRD